MTLRPLAQVALTYLLSTWLQACSTDPGRHVRQDARRGAKRLTIGASVAPNRRPYGLLCYWGKTQRSS